jgi:hypothetical protein
MKSATGIVASVVGAYAGLLGATHGVLEILQGNVAPGEVMIQAIGAPGIFLTSLRWILALSICPLNSDCSC